MKKYSKELKDNIITRMLPPANAYIPDLAKETGIPRDTLYSWRIKHKNAIGNPKNSHGSTDNLRSEEKFSTVLETAGMNEIELSQYCREKGIYPEQIAAWRTSCSQANARHRYGHKTDKKEIHKQAQEIKQLKRELRHKEKALAETAALLVLKKKLHILLGEPGED